MAGEVSPFLVLQARAEARAYLFTHGEYETIEAAVQPLVDYAVAAGIVEQIGIADAVAMIEAPFVEALHG